MTERQERLSMREQLERLFGKRPTDLSGSGKKSPLERPAPPPKLTRSVAAAPSPQPTQVHPPPAKPQPPNIDRTSMTVISGDAALNFVIDKLQGVIFRGPTAPPTDIAHSEVASVSDCIQRGAAIFARRPDPDEAGFLVGFDFGTSSTKVVIHQPGAGDPAYALPVPATLRIEEFGRRQDHLWRTIVWYNPDTQRFALVPGAGFQPVEGFKTRLIQSDEHGFLGPVRAIDAAAAYLAMLFAFTLGYHAAHAPAALRRDAHYSRFHFGVPVASIDDPKCARAFRVCLNAAIQLAPHAADLTLDQVQRECDGYADPSIEAITPCLLFEELAAVVAGYMASPDRRHGPHVIVDVGASTLDVATFNITQERVAVLYSSVELLGADSLTFANSCGVTTEQFIQACYAQSERVLYVTRTKRDEQYAYKNGTPKPLIFIGGGRLHPVYEKLYEGVLVSLQSQKRTPSPGANLEFDATTDFARLLVAWGLSQDVANLPTIKPPSQIEDLPSGRGSSGPKSFGDSFPSKDVC